MATSNQAVLGVCAAVALLALGTSVWVGSSLGKLRAELATDRTLLQQFTARGTDDGTDQRSSGSASVDDAVAGLGLTAGIEMKQVSDIKARVNLLSPDAGLDEVAMVLDEMDRWIFVAGQEQAANEKLEKLVDTFRRLLKIEIHRLEEVAIKAEKGEDAGKRLTRINDLLSLYPTPRTGDQRAELEQLTTSILKTSTRVAEIRRLRYNEWAVSQIESAINAYHENKGRFLTDDRALVNGCVQFLKEIDPTFLEPATADLYSHVLSLTANKVDEDHRVQLARDLANAGNVRRSPGEF